MGTDTDTFTQACVCGQGLIEITMTSPDHRWPSAYNVHRSYSFKCAPCATEYQIDDHGRVLRRSEEAANRQAREAWHTAIRAYDGSSEILALKVEFATLLGSHGTKKAMHEFLTRHGFTKDKYGSFTRNFKDAQSYVGDIHPIHSPMMAQLLGKDATPFQARLAALQAQQDAIPSAKSILVVKPFGD